jgi:hypothetical protein
MNNLDDIICFIQTNSLSNQNKTAPFNKLSQTKDILLNLALK